MSANRSPAPFSRIPQSTCNPMKNSVLTASNASNLSAVTPRPATKPTPTGIPKPVATITPSASLPPPPAPAPPPIMPVKRPLAPAFSAILMPNSTRGAVYERLTLVQKIATKRKCFAAERRRLADAQKQVLGIQSTIAQLQEKLRDLCRGDAEAEPDDVAALQPLRSSLTSATSSTESVVISDCALDRPPTMARSSSKSAVCIGCRDRDQQIEVLLDERDAILHELNGFEASQPRMYSYKRTDELTSVRLQAATFAAQLDELQRRCAQEQIAHRRTVDEMLTDHAAELAAVRRAYEQQLEAQRRVEAATRSNAAHLLHIRSQVIAQMQLAEDAVRQQLQATRSVALGREAELQRTLELLHEQEQRGEEQLRSIAQLEKERDQTADRMAGAEDRAAQLDGETQRMRRQFKQIMDCRHL